MDLELRGKRAVVTGASRGIGRAVAAALLREGVSCVLGARREEPLRDAASGLAAAAPEGVAVVPVVVDTGSEASITAFVDAAVAALGGVDILVNAAAAPSGQQAPPKVVEVTGPRFYADFDVKVLGYLRTIAAVAPHMAAQRFGRIVNVDGLGTRMTGSVMGSMRNAAVAALTKNAADELGGAGITVTAVSPGMVRTEATPGVLAARAAAAGTTVADIEAAIGEGYAIGRMVTAEEVAWVVTMLASPRSIAITGDVVACGGGVKGSIYY
ncbi:SDR family oxidoreductase [Acidiferrimicrobium sp. IK]|uniref:SDR family NAD(P)-dependent oxidoreductase n=1 Tax=Acidiferrimicrobium sp. IK TaxID=2871700 RepID=UPI0021CB37E0|nr:SDR family oxidoreductase [Acidiferrimicrobium sp. IK]MCU4183213.1 SDR family oxidoreductase [Acidiferrimicrobium sp. IK]